MERAARRVHRVGRTGARAKCGEGLHQLAETAASHEEVLLLLLLAHQPKADASHAGEVEEQDDVVDDLHKLLRLVDPD